MVEPYNIIYYRCSYSILFDDNFILNYNGILGVIPNNYLEYKIKRDGNNKYHLTVITAQEMKNINRDEFEKEIQSQTNIIFDVLGLGINNSCYYLE